MTAPPAAPAALEAFGRERGLDRPAIDRVTSTVFGLIGREAERQRRAGWRGARAVRGRTRWAPRRVTSR